MGAGASVVRPGAWVSVGGRGWSQFAHVWRSPPSWASVLRPTMSLGSGSASDIAVMRDVEEEEEDDDDVEAQ